MVKDDFSYEDQKEEKRGPQSTILFKTLLKVLPKAIS